MLHYTPLRYPGGKRRLALSVAALLEHNGLRDVKYAEPYAGGASVALRLLLEEYASEIHINDLSRPVFAFWHSVLNETEELCRRIDRVKVSMREWQKQRAIYLRRETADLADVGFATFFLNRTNRSGILNGGVIGGKKQGGEWKLDVRFNKVELTRRIRMIARFRNRINLYRMDAMDFSKELARTLGPKSFIFYDPPYIEKGEGLYLNEYDLAGHRAIEAHVLKQRIPWAVVYDYAAVKHDLFASNRRLVYWLHYCSQDRHQGREVMYFSDRLSLPPTSKLLGNKMHIVRNLSRLKPS